MPRLDRFVRAMSLELAVLSGLSFGMAGCVVGPEFSSPKPAAPEDWSAWHSGDASLRASVVSGGALPEQWWEVFQDPVLDQLQQRALTASPDLATAALRFAQARVVRQGQDASRLPTVDLEGSVMRQRQSEFGAGIRVIDAITGIASGPGIARDEIVKVLTEPFTLYQAGFDASWELDLWGRVRRSIESADADVARQAALLEQARLSLLCEVARNYLELRGVRKRLALTRQEVVALEDRLGLMDARVKGGLENHFNLLRQRGEVSAMRAQVASLLAQESALVNQVAILVGERPGALSNVLGVATDSGASRVPDLALGVASDVAQRRPDIRAAEARLRSSTANIGVAQAQLYPSIRLGARGGLESFLSGEFFDWGSRVWSIGPSLTLPIFDGGRRRAQVELRELEQQEAAVSYHRTVLQAWREIDDALTAYAAEQQQFGQLEERTHAARESYELARARYDGGAVDFTSVLDSQRAHLQASIDLASGQSRLETRFVAINKAIGNAPPVAQR